MIDAPGSRLRFRSRQAMTRMMSGSPNSNRASSRRKPRGLGAGGGLGAGEASTGVAVSL